jgi:hypothetical protein
MYLKAQSYRDEYENRKQEVVYLPEGHTTHWKELPPNIRLLQKMRTKLNKLENEFVSIEEFPIHKLKN